MEFLNFIVIFVAGYLVWRKPEKEKLAFRLLLLSLALLVYGFFVGSRTSILPGVNF